MMFIRRCESCTVRTVSNVLRYSTANETKSGANEDHEEFRVLRLIPTRPQYSKHTGKVQLKQPQREHRMPVNQDWPSVWPVARTFHPGSVPLPVRQGYKHNKNVVPNKYGNAELMKIPNFLHLTPPAVQRHCEALKRFCTQWPTGLHTDEACEKHFPLEIISSDYCYSSPTIREPLARIVSLKVKLSALKLDAHAKDKMLRLLGNRYDPETDIITIVADRCPTRKQNLDYAKYLLTAVFHESWRVEPWEAEKSEADMEYFDWDKSTSRKNLVTMHKWPTTPTDYDYDTIPHAIEYKTAVSNLMNNGEDQFSIDEYKKAVKHLLKFGADNKEG